MVVTANILEDLRNGSQDAFKSVYLHWRKPIYMLLLKLTGSDADAEDITQDVFIKLWENHHKVIPSKDIRSLLYVIARHSAYNHLDRKKTRYKYQGAEEIDYENSYDIVVAKETELLKELALSRMSDQRRRIYRMNVEENLDAQHIADQLGLTRETVYNQVSAAKKDLRELISVFMLFFVLQ